MPALLQLLTTIFGGSGLGAAIANVGKGAAMVAAVPLVWKWYQGHGTDVILTMNVQQGLFFALFAYTIIQVAHRSN
jgi:hypothetical protein